MRNGRGASPNLTRWRRRGPRARRDRVASPARVGAGAAPQPDPDGECGRREGEEKRLISPAREAPQPFDAVAEAISDRVAHTDDGGHVDERTQEVGDKEADGSEPRAAGERAGEEPEAGDEAGDEDG